MSEMGFITKSVLSIAGTAAIYIVAFKNPVLLRELAKNPSMLTKELDLLYVSTRSANRALTAQRDILHLNETHQSIQTALPGTEQHLSQSAPPIATA